MIGKRTGIDFSKHKAIVTMDLDEIAIHKLEVPHTKMGGLFFINTQGILTVGGNFNNWVFDCEFHPHIGFGEVSDHYWDEKLEKSSKQEAMVFDHEETEKFLDGYAEYYLEMYDDELSDEQNEFIDELKNRVENEYDFIDFSNNKRPDSFDFEMEFHKMKRHHYLDVVYDAFEVLCLKLEENAKNIQPFIKTTKLVKIKKRNMLYNQHQLCKCGHEYKRHFDSDENKNDVDDFIGENYVCKYRIGCKCEGFEPKT